MSAKELYGPGVYTLKCSGVWWSLVVVHEQTGSDGWQIYSGRRMHIVC